MDLFRPEEFQSDLAVHENTSASSHPKSESNTSRRGRPAIAQRLSAYYQRLLHSGRTLNPKSSGNISAGSTAVQQKSPPRLMNLPVEIRLMVLAYTDLVIPKDYDERPPGLLFISGNFWYGRGWESACRSQIKHILVSKHHLGRGIPSALFYVCRQLSIESRKVCFSHNQLSMVGSPLLNLNRVLRPQPQEFLRCVRQFRYVFPEGDLVGSLYMTPKDIDLQWFVLVEFIRQNFVLPQLAIIIDGSEVTKHRIWISESSSRHQRDMTKWYSTYESLIRPMNDLKGLKRLVLHCPFCRKQKSYTGIRPAESNGILFNSTTADEQVSEPQSDCSRMQEQVLSEAYLSDESPTDDDLTWSTS